MSTSHQTVRLSAGRHDSPDDGACVMELASMLADEPFSDRPRSVSPTLASTMRGYNDGLDDARRQTLKRFAAAAIGTAGDRAGEKRRRELIRAAMAEQSTARGFWAGVARLLDAAEPYQYACKLGRRVAADDDDVLHARMLVLLDALVAVEPRGGVLYAPVEAPCEHHCPPERTEGRSAP